MPDLYEIIVEKMSLEIQHLNSTENLIIENNYFDILSVQEQGPQGPAGADGDSSHIEVIASGAIGGHRIVNIFNGYATYASNIDNYIGQLGITTSATGDGGTLSAYISGVVTELMWNFSQGPIYLSTNGLMTQTLPASNAVVIIGNAVSPTEINVNFQVVVKRS